MGLFGRRRATDPSSWSELWEALAPLGGSLAPASVRRWEDVVATAPPAFLEAASEQLGYGYRLLGTEAHAREIGPGAFVGTDRPFAAERFVRVVDAVVVAGAEAVARVAADPTAIGPFAAGVPVLDPADPDRDGPDRDDPDRDDDALPLAVELLRVLDRARFERGAELRAPWTATRPVLSPVRLDRAALRSWPSLAGRTPSAAFAGIPDPGVPWLEVDAVDLDQLPGAEPGQVVEPVTPGVVDAATSWSRAGAVAAARLLRALGPDALGPDPLGPDGAGPDALGPDPLGPDGAGLDEPGSEADHSTVRRVRLTPWTAADGTSDEPEVWGEVLEVPVPLGPDDARTTGADARAEVLVRVCARRLVDVPLVATPRNVAVLRRLAAEG